jgi:putative transport protein
VTAWMQSLVANPVLVLGAAVMSGLLVGRIRFSGMTLGASGALFTGLLLGFAGCSVPETYFTWNLVLFVAAVGLLSAEDIVPVVRRYGFRFVGLGAIVPAVGALVTYILARLYSGSVPPHLLAGTYTGALTSSPGLGAALEATSGNPLVTVGYTVAYPFGVLAVVLFVQLAPRLFRMDLEKERAELASVLASFSTPADRISQEKSSVPFTTLSFMFCIVGGVLLGSVPLPLFGFGSVSLGSTGGVLLFALCCGALGRIGSFPMRMDTKSLVALRALSLACFLAAVGISAGPKVISAVLEHGVLLIAIGTFSAVIAELVGFFLGRYVWKLNWILLAGAICGAMTSTPGLGAAIEATEREECSAGYGAAYPMAIVGMVLFTKLLHHAFD